MNREERVVFCKEYITRLLLVKLNEWKTRYDKLTYEEKVETLYDPNWDNGCYGRKYNHYETSPLVDLDMIQEWVGDNDLYDIIYEMTREVEEENLQVCFLKNNPDGVLYSEEFYEYEEEYYENYNYSPDLKFIDTLLYEIFDIFYYEEVFDYVEGDRHNGNEPTYKNDFLKRICRDKGQMRDLRLDLLLLGEYETPSRRENTCEVVEVVETYRDEWNHQYKNITFSFYYEGHTGTITWCEDWGTYELYEVDGDGFDLEGSWYGKPRHQGLYEILNKKRSEMK